MPQQKKKNPLDDLYPTTPTPQSSLNPLDELYPKQQPINPLDDLFPQPQQEPGFITGATALIQGSPTAQKVIGTISPILDFISRPSYASAKFADSLADESKTVFDAALDAWDELVATGADRKKLSYSDVIKRRSPEFALNNPTATTILGFIGDVALDPTSYLGTGLIKDGITVGGKVLTRPTLKVFKEGLQGASTKAFVAKDGTIELIEKFQRANNIKPQFDEVEDLFKYMSYDVASTKYKEGTDLTQYVQRIEEPGISTAGFDKPHGIYTTPANVTSPFEDLGGTKSYWKIDPKANILDVSDVPQSEIIMRPQAINAGSGVAAAYKLLGAEEFNFLRGLRKDKLIKTVQPQFPNVDFTKYYDPQEVMEAIGAQLAKKEGFDAIRFTDNITPEFNEYIGLTSKSMTSSGLPTKSGVSIEESSPNLVKYVNRNPQGKPTGILEINFDDKGKILSSSLAVDPNIKGLQSVAYKLYKTAKDQGYDLSEAAEAGLEKFTTQGLNFAKRIVEKELKDVGYFDAVKAKQVEIEDLLNNLTQSKSYKFNEVFNSSPDNIVSGIPDSIKNDLVGKGKVSTESLGLSSKTVQQVPPGSTVREGVIHIKDIVIGRDTLNADQISKVDDLMKSGFNAQGLDSVTVSFDDKLGKWVAHNGSHRLAALKLSGVEGKLPVRAYVRSNDLNRIVTEKPYAELAQVIAKDETLADLKRFGKERLPDELGRVEVRERVTQRIQKLVELQPELQKKFFEKSGVYIKVGLPFGKQYDLLRVAGLEGVTNKVKAISSYLESAKGFNILGKQFKPGAAIAKAGEVIAKTFNRDYGLPKEFIDLRNDLENQLGYITGQTIRDTRKLFVDVDKEGRQRVGSAMLWIDDQTRILEELRLAGGSQLGSDEAADLFRRGLDKFKLTDVEKSIATGLRQDYAEIGLLEMRAGLLKNNLINYSPRGYEVIGDPDDFQSISRAKFNPDAAPSAYLSSSQQRKYLTNAEAEAAGLVPELDAAMLYAHRVIASRRALEVKQFRDSVEGIFGTVKQNTEIEHTGILPTRVVSQAIPQRVIDDMRIIGQSVYPKDLDGTIKDWLKGYDKLLRLFKRGATTIRPGFAVKQLPANTILSALVSGIRAFKLFDPRVFVDAAFLLGTRGNLSNNIPAFINNFITKTFVGNGGLDSVLASRVVLSKLVGENQLMDFAKDFRLRTALGDVYTGEEIVRIARENGIIREIDSTGEQFSKKVRQELDETYSVKSVAGELAKVWNHASMVEDYSRMGLFLNGLRMGKSAKESSQLVNKALFDYQRGLSGIERDVIKRILPFYTFQRFAIPFVLKESIKQPGNSATVEKFVRTIEKLLVTGEELSSAEENVLNGNKDNYLLTQPRLVSGFDEKGRVNLNILNNLTPFDVLNLFAYDKDGNVDYRKTAEKTVLGALTPFVKVPLEGMLQTDFFTDRTVKEASVYGNLKGSLSTLFPQYAKELIGWEDRTNLQTGKTTTFISPWMGYYATQFFPALRDIIKGNEDAEYSGSNPMVRAAFAAMNTLIESSRVSTRAKIDLKAQAEYDALKVDSADKSIIGILNKAKIRGSKTEYDKAFEDFNRLIETFKINNTIRQQGIIRGQGIGQQNELDQEAQSPIPTITQMFK